MHDQFRNEKCAVCGMKLFEDEEIVESRTVADLEENILKKKS